MNRFHLTFVCICILAFPTTALSVTWVVRPDSSGDFITIQAAIDSSQVVSGDTIALTNGVFTGPGNMGIDFKGKVLTLRSLSGHPDSAIIDCQGLGQGIAFHSYDTTPVLEAITIANGFTYAGGGIRCDSLCSPTVRNCVITNNQADIGGGVACFWASRPKFIDCRIVENFAGGGGGVYSWVAFPEFENCHIDSNNALVPLGWGDGGGIYSDSLSVCCLDTCTITGNRADERGGGMFCVGETKDTLVYCDIIANRADNSSGGGLCCFWSSPDFSNCTFDANRSGVVTVGWVPGWGGAALCSCSPAPRFTDCVFRHNKAYELGGGVYCYRSSPEFISCVLDSNSAVGYVLGTLGGGVFCDLHSAPTFRNVSLTRNSAEAGGGIMCVGFSSPEFDSCEIRENVAVLNGGGIACVDSSEAQFRDCDILANTVGGAFGGGVELYLSSASFSRCHIDSNSGPQYGGGISCRFSSPTFDTCSITYNAADSMGGGGFLGGTGCLPVFTGCNIDYNEAKIGAGVNCINASPTLDNCTLSGNIAATKGGGVNCDTLSAPVFNNCVLDSNEAQDGGAVYCISATPQFTNCLISNNSVASVGGGVASVSGSNPSLTNCVLTANSAASSGGGICCFYGPAVLNHCTLSGNSTGGVGGGVACLNAAPSIKSTIVGFSQGDGIYFLGAAASVIEYCDIYGNSGGELTFSGNNPANGPPNIGVLSAVNAVGDSCDQYMNIFLAPAFADTAASDFHLSSPSHCIGAADSTSPPPSDMDGNPRPNPVGSLPDIGAYEDPDGPLCGPISGTLGPGIFHVICDMTLASGDSLRIVPGTVLTYDGPYGFSIAGELKAVGAWDGSIYFTTDTLANPGRWRGLNFEGPGASNSHLECCVIENARAIGVQVWEGNGGGIYCGNASPSFTLCTIRNNSAEGSGGGQGDGGGVCCLYGSSPVFTSCAITDNECGWAGGGIECTEGSANFTRCLVARNSANTGGGVAFYSTSASMDTCTIRDNSARGSGYQPAGGGIACYGGSPALSACTIGDNSVWGGTYPTGGGIYCTNNASSAFTNCLVTDNSSAGDGGGAQVEYSSSSSFIYCTLSYNSAAWDGGGMFLLDCAPTVNSTGITFSTQEGIYFFGSACTSSVVKHCDFYNALDIAGNAVPAGLGQLVTVNANADSCDKYYNIFFDPLFADSSGGNFRLTDFSPCLGGADPSLTITWDILSGLRPNPPGSVGDIGAYENSFDAFASVGDREPGVVPITCALFQNQPNPFGGVTEIRYNLARDSWVSIEIFNILGRKVATVVNDRQSAGYRAARWNATSFPCGIYFCRLKAGQFEQTMKMILLR